jgi:hypothetical protein
MNEGMAGDDLPRAPPIDQLSAFVEAEDLTEE